MNEELKGKLKAALLKAGLNEGLLGFVNIEKEEEIQGVVSNLLSLKTPTPTLDELIKQKEIQSEIDRRISEARKSWEQKPPAPATPPEGLTAEKIAEMMAAALNPLTEKLGVFEKNKTREEKLSQAKQFLSTSKIPEANRGFYLDLYNPESETPLTQWVAEQESKHEAYAQSLVDSTQLSSAPPMFGGNHEMTESEAQRIAESITV